MSSALRRLTRPKAAPEPRGERPERPGLGRCEMCTALIDEHEHSHVVHLEQRSLLCTCRPCALLFTERGAAGGRYRAVPDRYLRDPSLVVTEAQWDELQIPVRMAFFFHNSELGRPVAFYPSPAGATESLLPLDAWWSGLGGTRLAGAMEPDVEALLLHQARGATECLLVPIDACYELVGLVRTHWKGFDGGGEASERIGAFFADLAGRAREMPADLPGREG